MTQNTPPEFPQQLNWAGLLLASIIGLFELLGIIDHKEIVTSNKITIPNLVSLIQNAKILAFGLIIFLIIISIDRICYYAVVLLNCEDRQDIDKATIFLGLFVQRKNEKWKKDDNKLKIIYLVIILSNIWLLLTHLNMQIPQYLFTLLVPCILCIIYWLLKRAISSSNKLAEYFLLSSFFYLV